MGLCSLTLDSFTHEDFLRDKGGQVAEEAGEVNLLWGACIIKYKAATVQSATAQPNSHPTVTLVRAISPLVSDLIGNGRSSVIKHRT